MVFDSLYVDLCSQTPGLSYRLLGCGAIRYDINLLTFRRNLLFLSSDKHVKQKVASPSGMSTNLNHTKQRHLKRRHGLYRTNPSSVQSVLSYAYRCVQTTRDSVRVPSEVTVRWLLDGRVRLVSALCCALVSCDVPPLTLSLAAGSPVGGPCGTAVREPVRNDDTSTIQARTR